jgi:Mg-chelatase subunit ChlD
MSRIGQFAENESGSVLPIFALSILPLFGLMGAAIDYSRAAATRTDMQSALDSVAIMLSKDANKLTTAEIQTKANDYFTAVFNRPEAKSITITPVFSQTDGTFSMQVSGSGEVPTRFMNIMGFNKMDIASSTEVKWGSRRLELALALDNTGSMAWSGKMDELKKASKALLDTLKKSAIKPETVKVSIVPFATDVNVGTGNVNATWLDWSDWDAENGADTSIETCTGKNGKKKKCTSSTSWVPNAHSTWNGCVWDRDKPHDIQDTAPTSKQTRFQPHQADNCPVAMLPLTNDWNALNAKIDAMIPTGNTNVTIGLEWGWHTLTSGEPMTQAVAPAKDLDKVIILLTDGTNTANRWSDEDGGDAATKAANIDARTKLACDNVKATGIKLYTVRVIDGNADLLKNCASDPTMFYDVQNSSGLVAVFNKIGENLATLRIAK